MENDGRVRERKWKHFLQSGKRVTRRGKFEFAHPSMAEEGGEVLNVLFVCSMNKWRSRTAEDIYKKHPLLECRSGGTSKKARRRIGSADLQWADLIVLMEDQHYEKLSLTYQDELEQKEIHVLGLEDNYRYMDEDLIEELQYALDSLFLVEGKE